MQIHRFGAKQGRDWLARGWRLVTLDLPTWLMMSGLYLLFASMLNWLPFVGYLVLVLLTPMLVAGAALHAAEVDSGETTRLKNAGVAALKERAARAAGKLLQIFNDADRTLAVMVVATLTLGAIVLIQILAQLLKVGGAALPAMLKGGVGASIWVPALLALIVVWLAKLIVLIAAVCAVYFIVLHRDSPLTAMERSINACGANILPLLMAMLPLLVPLIVAAYVHWLITVVLGLIVLPWVITSLYVAYKDMHSK